MTNPQRTSGQAFRDYLRTQGWLGSRRVTGIPSPPGDRDAGFPPPDTGATSGEFHRAPPPRRGIFSRLAFPGFRDCLADLGPFRSRILFATALGLASTLLHALMPLAGKYLIDTVLPARDFRGLLLVSAGLAALALLLVLFEAGNSWLERALTGGFVVRLKRRLMRRLLALPLARAQELKVGGMLARLTSDTEGLGGLLQNGVLAPARAALMFAVGLAALFWLNARAALLYLGFAAILAVLTTVFLLATRQLQRALRADQAAISGRLAEALGGLRTLQAFLGERAELLRFTRALHLWWRKDLHTALVNIAAYRAAWGVYFLLVAAVWLVGGWQVMEGRLTVGGLVAFFFYTELVFDPVFLFFFSLAEVQSGLACAERVYGLLAEEPPAAGGAHPGPFTGLRLQRLSFAYPGNDPVLRDLDLELAPGSFTALTGPSGAGKSTLAHILLRFLDPPAGTAFLSGQDLLKTDPTAIRQQLRIVLQEDLLFDGTVRENLALGRPDATDAEITEALRLADGADFVAALPTGLDTEIGERGLRLSGGQRQRLAIARAVLCHPALLILDEATADVDADSEARILANLRAARPGMAILLITHRASGIALADRVLRLEAGRM